MTLTATHLNYSLTCRRKLWLFARQITREQNFALSELEKAEIYPRPHTEI